METELTHWAVHMYERTHKHTQDDKKTRDTHTHTHRAAAFLVCFCFSRFFLCLIDKRQWWTVVVSLNLSLSWHYITSAACLLCARLTSVHLPDISALRCSTLCDWLKCGTWFVCCLSAHQHFSLRVVSCCGIVMHCNLAYAAAWFIAFIECIIKFCFTLTACI